MSHYNWFDVLAWWGAPVDINDEIMAEKYLSNRGHISSDSRSLVSGDIFIALAGTRVHGVAFAPVASAVGALVISDRAGEGVDLVAPELQARLGDFLNWFYDSPSQALSLVGITGTNGKTSSSHYLAQWLDALGVSVAVIGTVGNGLWGALSSATHTTPDAPSLYRQLAQWRDANIKVVIMEVSSHAIDQHRIIGLSFAVLALTQVTRDHLDYHGSIEAYHDVKSRLFTDWHSNVQVLNQDDAMGKRLALVCRNVLVYSLQEKTDIYCLAMAAFSEGMELAICVAHQPWAGTLPLYGEFNIQNILCALGCFVGLGYRFEQVMPLLSKTYPVMGRMQRVTQNPVVVVDYAHTPDALAKALQALRVHCTQGHIFVVFGAGGNRDCGKRPLMGAVAMLGADCVIVTDDNPRDEVPAQIAADIMAGINRSQGVRYIANRQLAICTALSEASKNDMVLIAGKGHENYQEMGGVRVPFSDITAVLEC